MTIALTSFIADGVEVDEAVTKRFRQRAIFTITAANTDVDIDIGDYTGTFWTAVGGSVVGAKALLAIKDINTRARCFNKLGGSGVADRVQADASQTSVRTLSSAASSGGAGSEALTVTGLVAATDTILAVTPKTAGAAKYQFKTFTSAATAGGGATEAVVVTGLATTDIVVSVTQKTAGIDSLPLLGWSTLASNAITGIWSADPKAGAILQVNVLRTGAPAIQAWSTLINDGLTVVWAADPGAGAVVQVLFSRTGVTTVAAGTYQMALDATNVNLPDILFVTGDAPTAYTLVIEWELANDQPPVQLAA